MSIQIIVFLCAMQMFANECKSLKFIDLPSDSDDPEVMESTTKAKNSSTTSISDKPAAIMPSTTDPKKSSNASVLTDIQSIEILTSNNISARRFLPLLRQGSITRPPEFDEDEDALLKKKIAVIIQQTVHDTTKKVSSIQKVKERIVDQAPYKAGYILSLVRKSRLMLNDLFNLAVKHRDNWKALQQLKVFEYIVHTNVDTTNLVRQLVEVHMQFINSTLSARKRVVLI